MLPNHSWSMFDKKDILSNMLLSVCKGGSIYACKNATWIGVINWDASIGVNDNYSPFWYNWDNRFILLSFKGGYNTGKFVINIGTGNDNLGAVRDGRFGYSLNPGYNDPTYTIQLLSSGWSYTFSNSRGI